MNFATIEAAQAAERELEQLKAKRSRELMARHNREMKARKEAEAAAKAKSDAAKKAAKEKEIQQNLAARVRARILSSKSATEADVARLFNQVRDQIILEDGRKAEAELEASRRRQLHRYMQKF